MPKQKQTTTSDNEQIGSPAAFRVPAEELRALLDYLARQPFAIAAPAIQLVQSWVTEENTVE